MANIRIHEIAKELGYSNKEILEKAKELGFKVTTSSSAVTPEDAAQLYDYVQSGKKPESLEKKDIKQNTQKEAPETQTQQKPIEQEVETKQNVDSTPIKVEPKQESLASSTLSKRRGLVIVKKKKVEVQPIQKQQSEPINKGLEAIFGSSDENLKKKKKEKKPIIATKKENSAKIDLLSAISFSDDISIDDEDVVVLPDLTVKPIEIERQNTVKKQINVYKTSQNNSFSFEGGIQRNSRKKHKKVVKDKDNEDISSVDIPKEIRLYEFADKIKKSSSEVIAKLFMLGKMTTKNDFLEEDEIEILGAEFGIEVNIVDTKEDFDYVKAYEDEILEDNSVSRAPVVTIMGHVDHGKTSLLDYIRNSRVASGEAGGITQHVGAYMVEKSGKNITFIDTPGHEAFTAMRARGASVTDIVIIVVAADDGVKPQTKEAINHAKAAGVPIIIAINKMDKESANPDLVKTGLAELDILPTEWGGGYEFVPISAKTGIGIEDLLEIVLLQAELLELKANPDREAKATIIESSLQKGRGPVATAIVENGTLRVGDTIVAGVAYGKVRALQDDKGNSLKSIKPGECGVIIGLSEVPDAGETLISVKTDKEAREYAQKKYDYLRQKELSKSTKVTIDELSAKIAEGELKSLPVIIKADVQGSLEAIKASLEKLKNDEIKVDIIHSGVGGISQSDITLASASSNCVILGFNIRPTGDVKEKAKERSVEIKTYNVIYNLIDDVKALLSGLMSPIISEEELGQAVIRQVINVPKIGQIAGCMVTDGSINRGAKIRVIRDGVVVFEGNVSSLKRFKDDVKEVAKGYECGVGIEGYNDMREGDYIESYKEVESKVEL
ncbi:translation initiation factor IF-2 [Campylobacter fetus]|uniref:Translation initiation factor IF-2 n=1 Tax=Campylobacter fetus TaxID=196 RepID=A0A5N7FXA1_CAMFE|nr:translation initiation factor IF-2 [Campylobacter fetus]EAI4415283.1 translation initiation factor IF-2 [Campylobacter fetus]EAI5408408.1 translation initiation factor IF-2 [Campylobacter fetus]EAJ0327984.1 translation initiation factor IF-2 [Campylobacter fetus]EAJ1230840.1 translation initiation factor IF-2 [Campylobacter fetus]EAK0416266.1 translation initiation factor IF-2 [Campylobacter fetus]